MERNSKSKEKISIDRNSETSRSIENKSNLKKQINQSQNNDKINKITLYVLSRDFRTSDNLTLYQAYDESIKSHTNLCVIFRFNPAQISQESNQFYSSNSVQFMIEALEEFAKEINLSWIDQISDDEWSDFLLSIPIHKIFIARDFTPFARQRFDHLSSITETIEVDDITVFPVKNMKTFNKLAYFIDNVKRLPFPELEHRNVNWKDATFYLNNFISPKTKFVHQGEITIAYQKNEHLIARPKNFLKCLDKLGDTIKGYALKKIREQVGKPKVSHLSSFIKFGLISIRAVHYLAIDLKGPSIEDKLAFERELYFRDFFYRMAYDKPNDVFRKPNWQGKETPRFISEEDLLKWKQENGQKLVVSKEEFKDIEEAREIYNRWTRAETEYPLINAGINELTKTGYMLNRTRMLTCSYLTQDNKLWWKYAEKFFANHLTEYDWIINSMNHQNIAKVGMYPKYTQNFSIKRQESMNPKDKEIYYNNFNK